MASITLGSAMIAPADDPGAGIAVFTSGRSDSRSTSGEVRRYANGRLRVVTRAGSTQTIGLTVRYATASQVAFLDALRGSVVLFRDVMGRKLYGAFFDLDVTDFKDRQGQDVQLTLQQVTYSEAV